MAFGIENVSDKFDVLFLSSFVVVYLLCMLIFLMF